MTSRRVTCFAPTSMWTWSDTRRAVALPPRELSELGIVVVGYFRGGGRVEVTVISIEKHISAEAGVLPGDVFLMVNGHRPKDEHHLQQLFAQSTHRDNHDCLVCTPGIGRAGNPILALLTLMLLTLLLWFNDPWSSGARRRKDEL